MIGKAEYVLEKVKKYLEMKETDGRLIDPETLIELIGQWEFDYQVDSEIFIK